MSSSIRNSLLMSLFRSFTPKAHIHKVNPIKLRNFIEKMAKYAVVPRTVRQETVIIDGIDAMWSQPALDEQKDAVILYLHGGAYVGGSAYTHRGIVGKLVQSSRIKALSINYRLAPEHPFPAALHDAEKAYTWLLNNGYKSSRIVIAGDSAGGGLTVATLLKLRDSKIQMPAAAICLSPWLDLEGLGENAVQLQKTDPVVPLVGLRLYGELYAASESTRHPYVSPIHASMDGLPPILIQVSDCEVLLDDTVRFAEKARQAGVFVEVQKFHNVMHVWHMLGALLPEAKDAFKKLGSFIQAKVKDN
jgi:acetyl esterase/lipase